jgi:hypothetical protein
MPGASSRMIYSCSMHARSAHPVFVLGISIGDTESAQSIPCLIGPFRSRFVSLVRQEVVACLVRCRKRSPAPRSRPVVRGEMRAIGAKSPGREVAKHTKSQETPLVEP